MKFLYCLALLICSLNFSFSQTLNLKRSVQTLMQQRSIYLNGGARTFVEGTSRVILRVDLPPNTKSWYYSFSTSPGQSGISNLNLAFQLSALLLDRNKIGGSLYDKISVPQGSSSIDAFVMNQPNAEAFMRKIDLDGGTFYHFDEGRVQNTKQALVEMRQQLQGTFYIGLKNPSTLDGVNVSIEVAAIVEEVLPATEQQTAATTYGDLGWKAYQRGDYDRCLELSFKALELDNSLGYVYFNIGLSYLSKGLNSEALDAYTKAIAVTQRSAYPKNTFQAAIQDIYAYKFNFPSQTEALDILAILQQEVSKY